MKIINTDEVDPKSLKPWEREQVYNGLDCCVTYEVLEALLPQLDNQTTSTYEFSKALQAPCLEMRLRGVKIDKRRRREVVEEYLEKIDVMETNLERIVREGIGYFGFNWRSTKNLQELFYDRLGIPVIRKQGRPTVNRDALERMEAYSVAVPIVSHIKSMRDLDKKVAMLGTEIDSDGRMRTSYNIGGTTTGRLSSSFSEFGSGTNLQNVTESLRSVFIADPGMKMGYFDAEQGESRVVGAIEHNLFNDARYLDACETGDLHTAVAKLCWPRLSWTGILKCDKELAEQPYYRHYSRRFMCKKIGHGTNYAGRPKTLSTQAKVDIEVVEEFQPKYFMAFPAHLRWHAWVEREIKTTGTLTSLTGRKRQFWGRRDDHETLREAIAFDPQGSLADIMNNGMLNVWRARDCQLLMQIHDAILVQYPEELEDEIVPKILGQLRWPIELRNGRQFVMPYGCKTGWNWGDYSKDNPDGLKSYKPSDQRQRTTQVNLLDTVVR